MTGASRLTCVTPPPASCSESSALLLTAWFAVSIELFLVEGKIIMLCERKELSDSMQEVNSTRAARCRSSWRHHRRGGRSRWRAGTRMPIHRTWVRCCTWPGSGFLCCTGSTWCMWRHWSWGTRSWRRHWGTGKAVRWSTGWLLEEKFVVRSLFEQPVNLPDLMLTYSTLADWMYDFKGILTQWQALW